MTRILSATLLAIIFSCALVSALEHPSKRISCTYSYEDDQANGPSHWADVCPGSDACSNGKKQSPIDIITDSSFEKEAAALNATYHELDSVNFQNMGHTLQIFATDSNMGISGGPLPGFYQLVQAHFHAPSEHKWNGAQYPFEMHLVHSYDNGNKLAVLGFFFEHSSTPNTFLSQFESQISSIPLAGNVTTINAHWELLLKSVAGYYHYAGSLTTPPCSEIVDWLFSTTILKATPEQIENIAEKLHGNARPIQPINNRILYEYDAGWQNGGSSGVASSGSGSGNVFNFNFANMLGDSCGK